MLSFSLASFWLLGFRWDCLGLSRIVQNCLLDNNLTCPELDEIECEHCELNLSLIKKSALRRELLHVQDSRSRRLFKEYKEVQRDRGQDSEIQLVCDEVNIYRWTAHIKGPSDTPYQEGVFQLAINVPEQYPLVPPQVRFVTKIFHPNVHFKTGEICLDILKTAWSPAWTLQSVCRAVIALLAHPEADSPLNCDCGNLLRSGDNRGYRSMALMYTRLSASPSRTT